MTFDQLAAIKGRGEKEGGTGTNVLAHWCKRKYVLTGTKVLAHRQGGEGKGEAWGWSRYLKSRVLLLRHFKRLLLRHLKGLLLRAKLGAGAGEPGICRLNSALIAP